MVNNNLINKFKKKSVLIFKLERTNSLAKIYIVFTMNNNHNTRKNNFSFLISVFVNTVQYLHT